MPHPDVDRVFELPTDHFTRNMFSNNCRYIEESKLSPSISRVLTTLGQQTDSSVFSQPASEIFKTGGYCVKKDYVYDIPWKNMQQRRGGIIPYCCINGVRYFNLGLDRKYNELTDFGGQINFNDASALKGSLREFSEESLRIYGRIPEDRLNGSLVLYDLHILIVFVDVTDIIEGTSMEELQI